MVGLCGDGLLATSSAASMADSCLETAILLRPIQQDSTMWLGWSAAQELEQQAIARNKRDPGKHTGVLSIEPSSGPCPTPGLTW